MEQRAPGRPEADEQTSPGGTEKQAPSAAEPPLMVTMVPASAEATVAAPEETLLEDEVKTSASPEITRLEPDETEGAGEQTSSGRRGPALETEGAELLTADDADAPTPAASPGRRTPATLWRKYPVVSGAGGRCKIT